MTSCGIISKTRERCKDSIELLKALNVRFELKDLYINGEFVDEIIDRMGLIQDDREFLLMSLPLVFVNGKYFGVSQLLIFAIYVLQLLFFIESFNIVGL